MIEEQLGDSAWIVDAGLWRTRSSVVTCRESGLEQQVTVSLPARIGDLRNPTLLLCLDGPWMSGVISDATRIMSMSGEAPEAIVVGLGFTSSSMGEYLRQRARWYTPTEYVPPEVTGVKGLTAQECGRNATLIGFLRDQLLPALDAEFDPGERWFAGHSFSALCGLSALFAEPELFDRWLLASPSIWWDDRAILGEEERYAEANDDLHTHVFVSAGSEEDGDTEAGSFQMVANVGALATSMAARAYPGLQLDHTILQGDGHSSVIGNAVGKGLRALNDRQDR